MSLDVIHDIQSAYRKLIDALSRPGVIADLSEEAAKLDLESDAGCYATTRLMAEILLDTEVSFKVYSERENKVTHDFKQLSYAREAEANEADYIFVLRDAKAGDLLKAIETAKIGTLLDPHFSATLIIEVASLSEGMKLRLTGPGIQTFTNAEVPMSQEWLAMRTERNMEFPLGLDCIFVDHTHRLFALPRTTQVQAQEVIEWDM